MYFDYIFKPLFQHVFAGVDVCEYIDCKLNHLIRREYEIIFMIEDRKQQHADGIDRETFEADMQRLQHRRDTTKQAILEAKLDAATHALAQVKKYVKYYKLKVKDKEAFDKYDMYMSEIRMFKAKVEDVMKTQIAKKTYEA